MQIGVFSFFTISFYETIVCVEFFFFLNILNIRTFLLFQKQVYFELHERIRKLENADVKIQKKG